MNIFYFVIFYGLLITLSLIMDQILTVKITQIYGPKLKYYYLINAFLALMQNFILFFISSIVCFIFYTYKFDNNLTLINIFILFLFFPLLNKNRYYCKTSIRLVLILVFLITYFSITNNQNTSYLLYSPFTVILFIIACVSNIIFSYSNSYSVRIIRLTCLNFVLLNYFLNTDFSKFLVYILILNIFQMFVEKIFPRINNILTMKYLFLYLLLPALTSMSLNYIWFYFFYDKSLLYFMGF